MLYSSPPSTPVATSTLLNNTHNSDYSVVEIGDGDDNQQTHFRTCAQLVPAGSSLGQVSTSFTAPSFLQPLPVLMPPLPLAMRRRNSTSTATWNNNNDNTNNNTSQQAETGCDDTVISVNATDEAEADTVVSVYASDNDDNSNLRPEENNEDVEVNSSTSSISRSTSEEERMSIISARWSKTKNNSGGGSSSNNAYIANKKTAAEIPPPKGLQRHHIHDLPDEIVHMIMTYLSNRDLLDTVSLVDRRWHTISGMDSLWKVICEEAVKNEYTQSNYALPKAVLRAHTNKRKYMIIMKYKNYEKHRDKLKQAQRPKRRILECFAYLVIPTLCFLCLFVVSVMGPLYLDDVLKFNARGEKVARDWFMFGCFLPAGLLALLYFTAVLLNVVKDTLFCKTITDWESYNIYIIGSVVFLPMMAFGTAIKMLARFVFHYSLPWWICQLPTMLISMTYVVALLVFSARRSIREFRRTKKRTLAMAYVTFSLMFASPNFFFGVLQTLAASLQLDRWEAQGVVSLDAVGHFVGTNLGSAFLAPSWLFFAFCLPMLPLTLVLLVNPEDAAEGCKLSLLGLFVDLFFLPGILFFLFLTLRMEGVTSWLFSYIFIPLQVWQLLFYGCYYLVVYNVMKDDNNNNNNT